METGLAKNISKVCRKIFETELRERVECSCLEEV